MLVGVCVIACLTFRLCLPNALTRRAEVRSVFNRPPWTCRTSDPRHPGRARSVGAVAFRSFARIASTSGTSTSGGAAPSRPTTFPASRV